MMSLRGSCLALASMGLVLVAGCSEGEEPATVTDDDDDAPAGDEDDDTDNEPPAKDTDSATGKDDSGDSDDDDEDVKQTPTMPKPTPAKDSGVPTAPPVKIDAGPSTGGNGGKTDAGPVTGGGDSDAGPVTGGGSEPIGDLCAEIAGIKNYNMAGPFKVERKTSGTTKMWVPTVPAGCKVPVVHIANGTGGTCANYSQIHDRMASHGFLSVCFENTNTGAGTGGLMAIETARTMHPNLVSDKVGSNGHSQGGQAAFIVLALAEAKYGDKFTYAGLAMEPASGFGSQPSGGSWQSWYAKIKSPMLAFSGTRDTLVSEGWVQQGYAALSDSIEAYNWSAVGATHVPVPQAETNEIAVPWFRWKLFGDNEACKAFKALKMGSRWRQKAVQNEKQCL